MSIYGVKYKTPSNIKKNKKEFDFNKDKNKKLEMFKQCKNNIKKSSYNNIVNNKDINIIKIESNNKSNKDYERVLKLLKEERSKRKNLEKSNTELKNKVKKYNCELYSLKELIKESDEENYSLNYLISKKNDMIKELNLIIKDNKNTIKQLRNKISSLRNTNNNLKNMYNMVLDKNKKYSEYNIDDLNTIKRNEVNNLYKTIKLLKNSYKNILVNYEALLEANDKIIDEKYTKIVSDNFNIKEYIGYISIKDGKSVFINDNLKIDIDEVNLKDGTVCKVSLIDGEYKITKIYNEGSDIPLSKNIKKEIRRNKIVQKISNKYPKFNTNKSVLIINTRFKNIYVNGLNALGVRAYFNNPNEESIYRICSRIEKYDIVVLCVDRLGHDIVNAIKSLNLNNVYDLRKDTFDKLVYKVNYALEDIKVKK